MQNRALCLIAVTAIFSSSAAAAPVILRPVEPLVHLRSGGADKAAEWDDFADSSPASDWSETFEWSGSGEACLEIRQQDVKQAWKVFLNDKVLGDLVRDENDMVIYLPVPEELLQKGVNTLAIRSAARDSDDIRLGSVVLHRAARDHLLQEATLRVRVIDADTQQPLPCRLTILDNTGAMQSVTSLQAAPLAIRPGTVYTGSGEAQLGLPAGQFTIYAGRGFEYSLAQEAITLAAGEPLDVALRIRREVPTPGYVACDTHVHTLTHSGHGDCTAQERMLTLVGEGIELSIATDHNRQVDYRPYQEELGLGAYFTTVTGNEVTTRVGHFNSFPALPNGLLPDHKLESWNDIANEIERQPLARIFILNHARDLHSGVRPFGPLLFNAAVAERYDGEPIRVNAMEVVNSGATQTDPIQLFQDWMQLLNRGYSITPIGSSDSHDVARHFVGQGRTYVRCDDQDVGRLDVDAAVCSLLHGDVGVSYGLLTELTVNEKTRPGQLASAPEETLRLNVRVLGPHWVTPSRLFLFCNGEEIRDIELPAEPVSVGVKWQETIELPRPSHDVHFVALALGEGTGLYWRTAKPYQPLSPTWVPHTLGCSGAVWVDADRDGKRQCARDYAERLHAQHQKSLPELLTALEEFDVATASHVASLWHRSSGAIDDPVVLALVQDAAPIVRTGFRRYQNALRERDIARLHAVP